MTTKDTNRFVKEIPFKLSLQQQLKLTSKTKLFIYIPNFTNIKLSQGKNFENGFWSLSYQELKNLKIITSKALSFFQFLIIHKNPNQEEIVSNIYFQNGVFFSGPFINAEFTIINENTININVKSISDPKLTDTKFEISGIPEDGILSSGEKIDNGNWIIKDTQSKNFILKTEPNSERKKLNLSITGIKISAPHFSTTFNLIINLKEPILPYKTKYKEIKIPALKILQESKLKFDRYLLSIKNLPQDCCVKNATIIDGKWITEDKKNEELTLQYFDLEAPYLDITLEYILINKDFPVCSKAFILLSER